MPNNLRSKPIEGHVSDSAGNILRNTIVTIKQSTPSGTYVVDSVQTDDDGQFISLPLPNGVYDVYESGSKISRIIHTPDTNKIQCFKASSENFDLSSISDFNTLADLKQLNTFRAYIQLESLITDVYQYGNIFPIYDKDINTQAINDIDGELYHLARFLSFNSDSRITLTRFDIQYFSPLTSSNSMYKKIRWTGVPAVKFYKDSRLVIPLDYFSIVINNPKTITPEMIAEEVTITTGDGIVAEMKDAVGPGKILDLSYSTVVGDILNVKMTDDGVTIYDWYGIIAKISQGTDEKTMTLEKWQSSRFISDAIPDNAWVTRVFAFDGLFSSIMDINEEANQRFNVVENISAQDGLTELYNYNNAVITD